VSMSQTSSLLARSTFASSKNCNVESVVSIARPTACGSYRSKAQATDQRVARGGLHRFRERDPLVRKVQSQQSLRASKFSGPRPAVASAAISLQEALQKFEVDLVTEAYFKENGYRSTRRTKICCTIGPVCCNFEQLEALAIGGMNIARLNMCHGTRQWHQSVIRSIRRLNAEKGYCVAIMVDTEGTEIHMGDLGGKTSVHAEVRWPLSL
jgi:hypothetical protein